LIRRKKGSNNKIINAKRHEFNGIKFRSGLELFTYKKLIEANINDFKYEEVKFTLLDKFEFNNNSFEPFEKKLGKVKEKGFNELSNNIRAITYLPDFCCIKDDKTGWLIENKGFAREVFNVKWKLFKKHLVDNGYNVDLYLPQTQQHVLECIKLIKNKYYA
jgi:glutathione peroxidase-family protein